MPHLTKLFHSTLPDSATLYKTVLIYTTRQCHILHDRLNLHYQTVTHFTTLITLHYKTLPHFTALLYSTLPESDTLVNAVLLYTTTQGHSLQHCFTLHYQTVPHFTTQFYSKLSNSDTLYKTIYSKLQDSASFYNTVLLYSTLPDSATLSSTFLLFTTRKCNNLKRRFTLYY